MDLRGGRVRDPGHDRRRARARPRAVRCLRDGPRRGGLLPDAARPHGRGVPHEVRVPLRRRGGLGAAAPPLPADAPAQGGRGPPGNRDPHRSRTCRRRDLRRVGRRRRAPRSFPAAARAVGGERRRHDSAPAQPVRPSRRLPDRVGSAPPDRDRDRRAIRRDRGARGDGRRPVHRDCRDIGRRRLRPPPVPRSLAQAARGRRRRDPLVRPPVDRRHRGHLAQGHARARDPRRRRRSDAGWPLPDRPDARRPGWRRRAPPPGSSSSPSRRGTGKGVGT